MFHPFTPYTEAPHNQVDAEASNGILLKVQDPLNPAYGGSLVNLLGTSERVLELQAKSRDWPSWDLSPRQLCDLELLLTGGFSPLCGFMSRADYESTCGKMRLANGTVWPIPITLDVTEQFARAAGSASVIALRGLDGVMLAVLRVEEVWQPDRQIEAGTVYGTTSSFHPGVRHLLEHTHPWYVGGRLEGIQLPSHCDFRDLRLTPSEMRAEFGQAGWRRIVAFHTRNAMHRVQQELTMRAAKEMEANLLIHPAVGTSKLADVDYHARVRCYQALLPRYPKGTTKLALLRLATRMAGPREALWHAIIRKNYGCSHFVIGPDHAGAGKSPTGESFYRRYAAQELVGTYQEEIGISMMPSQKLVFVEDKHAYVAEDEVPNDSRVLNLSRSQLRAHLSEGREIPSWFTFPEVANELRRGYPPRHRQGFTVFFTGLSGSGKSTIANILRFKFLEMGGRPVTFLDGDLVRKHLSSELGFSKEHRDINIRRIGFVASEITKNGGIAICAPIAPYDSVRKEVRSTIEPYGGFILVHLSTDLATCEARDRKGLYAKARAGIVPHFTGISDPYEVATDAELVIDTKDLNPEAAAQEILLHLERRGYMNANGQNGHRESTSLSISI